MALIAVKTFAIRMALRISSLMLPFLAACAIVSPLPPEVSLLNLEVTGLSLSHAALNADLRIYNPNAIAVTLKEMDYVLKLNDVEVSTGRSTKNIRIGAEEYANASLRITSAYFDLWRVLKQVGKNENVEFGLKGKVKVGGFGVLNKTFLFDRQGSIPLEKIQP
jgi:LEA14-like dessication related protein